MNENDSRFLISSTWWQEWCDYTNFDMNQLLECYGLTSKLMDPVLKSKEATPKEERGRRRRDSENELKEERSAASKLEDQMKLELQAIKRKKSLERMKRKVESFKSSDFQRQVSVEEMSNFKLPLNDSNNGSLKVEEYKKPGKIRNQPLLSNSNRYQSTLVNTNYISLKPNLIEHHDYVLVPADVWAYFKSWYDFDFALLRYIKRDQMNHDKLYLELYPEKKLNEGGIKEQTSSPQRTYGIMETSQENLHEASNMSSAREQWQKLNEKPVDLDQTTSQQLNIHAYKPQLMPNRQPKSEYK